MERVSQIIEQHCPIRPGYEIAAKTISLLLDDPHALGAGLTESLRLQVRLIVGGDVSNALVEWIVRELIQNLNVVDRVQESDAPSTDLRNLYPWPDQPPAHVHQNDDTHFFTPASAALLVKAIQELQPRMIVEVGAWLGASTRFLLTSSSATVITIDTWLGSEEHQVGREWIDQHPAHVDVLRYLPETFIKNCWSYRDRLIRLRTTSLNGFHQIAARGLQPELIFLDGAHDEFSVAAELDLVHRLFPRARIVLDDYNPHEEWLQGLVRAANRFAAEHGWAIVIADGNACFFERDENPESARL